MKNNELTEFRRLSSHVGQPITKIERLRYEFQGQTEVEGGDLQLWFGDAVVLLGVSGDGETIRVTEVSWQDPFEGPLAPENEEYVASHGKWRLVDVSREAMFVELTEKILSEVVPLTNRFDKLIGAQLVAGATIVNAYVSFDEFHVSWGIEAMPRWSREWRDEDDELSS
jgi:hypothetical protein